MCPRSILSVQVLFAEYSHASYATIRYKIAVIKFMPFKNYFQKIFVVNALAFCLLFWWSTTIQFEIWKMN